MANPEKFLQEKYPDLPGSKPVEKAVQRELRKGEKGPQTKEARVQAYLDRIDKIISSGPKDKKGEPRGWRLLKNKLIREFSIKANDPDTLTKIAHSVYESEKKLAMEQGRGAEIALIEREAGKDGEVMEKYKGLVREKRDIQRQGLSAWLDYLKQNDAHHPAWFRYFVVRNLQKMGGMDKEKGEYAKRASGTIAPFPELNPEALGFVYRALAEGIKSDELTRQNMTEDELNEARRKQEKLARLIAEKDFAKLYAFAQIETAGHLNRESIEGQWVKYSHKSDHHILEKSLKGKSTGWCTAEGSAYTHLQGGDFYVYYTKGPTREYSEPRIAIRMENGQVAEVRGTNGRQELEPALIDIAQQKYHSLTGGEKFDKKSADMRRVTELVRKQKQDQDFTKDELAFLYEIKTPIEGFGYEKDPRINELKKERSVKADLSFVFSVPEKRISVSKNEALNGNIFFHYGGLYLGSLTSAEGLKLPEQIGGGLYLNSLTSAEGLKLPEQIGGDLRLGSLTSAEKNKLKKQYPNLKII